MNKSNTCKSILIEVGNVQQISIVASPNPDQGLTGQIDELICAVQTVLKGQTRPMTITAQTFFVKDKEDIARINYELEKWYDDEFPATTFLIQPPCDGQRVTVEAWGVSTNDVSVEFHENGVTTVAHDDMRWIHVGGVNSPECLDNAYDDTQSVFDQLDAKLKSADANFSDIVRVWLYQSGITELETTAEGGKVEAYRELNRSRTDLFEEWEKAENMPLDSNGALCYPPSTGIGMQGLRGLTGSCTALQSDNDGLLLIPLENPHQTSAFDYERRFSVKSPKFSRAMIMACGSYAITWVSGTASILDSESVHLNDIVKQTEQTIDNIESLISPENVKNHGVKIDGSGLNDLGGVRVYIKREEDYQKCREVCERRFGDIPASYVIADVCRPELLVEIEGVSFCKTKS